MSIEKHIAYLQDQKLKLEEEVEALSRVLEMLGGEKPVSDTSAITQADTPKKEMMRGKKKIRRSTTSTVRLWGVSEDIVRVLKDSGKKKWHTISDVMSFLIRTPEYETYASRQNRKKLRTSVTSSLWYMASLGNKAKLIKKTSNDGCPTLYALKHENKEEGNELQ